MITINLLKQISDRKGGTGRRRRGLFKAILVATIGVGIIIASVEILHLWLTTYSYRLPAISWRKAETGTTGAVDILSEAVAPKNATAAATQAKADTAPQDTFKFQAAAASAGTVVAGESLKAEPGPGKKAAYEIDFADKVFSTLTEVIPDEIEFTSISLDSFAGLSMAGQSPNRESVSRLFGGLPDETFQLAPPPRSFISSADSGGYRFHVESRVAFHVRPSDTGWLNPRPAPRENVPSEVAAFSGLLRANSIIMSKGPSRVSADNAGEYRRFRYSLSGSGTLPDIVACVRAVHEARLPCAFHRLHLLAAGDGKASIDADVDFITRN